MTAEMIEFFRLAPLGLLIGAYGTLIGAGGGSLLVPALLMLLPDETPAAITAMSLAVVFFNAYSGTVVYMRMGRVDYRLATLFTLSSLPGGVLGVLLVHEIPRQSFEVVFGLLLLALVAIILVDPVGKAPGAFQAADSVAMAENGNSAEKRRRRTTRLGAIGSAYVAVAASLVGIGGGIIHVPFLIRVLRVPPHTATATSHFVLTFVALAGTITHLATGQLDHGLAPTLSLTVGVMMGAPLGAALSTKLHGSAIMRLLALALAVVALRLLLSSLL